MLLASAIHQNTQKAQIRYEEKLAFRKVVSSPMHDWHYFWPATTNNRKLQSKQCPCLGDYSFNHSFSFPLFLWEESQSSSPRRTRNICVCQQQSLIILLAPHQDGPSKVGDVVTPPGPWSTSGSLSRGYGQLDMSRQSFVGHSGNMVEPTSLGYLDSEKWIDIQGFTNFTAAHLSPSVTSWTLRKNLISAVCTWDNSLSVITQDSWL